MSSKVISADAVTDCSPWVLPEVAKAGTRSAGVLTAKQLEAIQKQAYEEGFALGRNEGLAAARGQSQALAQRLQQLLTALARPFDELDQRVEQELAALAMQVARLLVRRELKTDPGHVVGAVREALAALPVASRGVRVLLHPEDAALVRDLLTLNEAEQPWKIAEDPMVVRGGCKVLSDTSQIDASVETRLSAIIAAVLGGERETDG
jgi:flagellar assembly protein FliH